MKPRSFPSRLLERSSTAATTTASSESVRSPKYQRHVDCLEQSSSDESQQAADDRRHSEKKPKELQFAFLSEKYERLRDDEERLKKKEEKKRRKKENYKAAKKNVGKALRATWKCLMLGLYNFALGYSTPITVAATFVPDFHPGRDRP